MKIGIDISSLQGAHRMRGIGYVANNFINNIPANTGNKYVFYIYEHSNITEKEILKNIQIKPQDYEVRYIHPIIRKVIFRFPGKLVIINKLLSKIRARYSYKHGSKKFGNVSDLDAFIQLNQSEPLARLPKKARNYFIAYDLIPYVLKNDYLWNYCTARSKGRGILDSINSQILRFIYIYKICLNIKKAYKLIAISEATKLDFEKYVNVKPEKIEVIQLGVNTPHISKNNNKNIGIVNRYHSTVWGYTTRPESLKDQRFLLFVGGVDNRRKLNDVVTAFNHLRAQGEDIKLVLSGDIMLGPEAITTQIARESLRASSYLNDIYFLGFTDDETRDWLYSAALAFIFPSVYEGFGLPVLEAMQYHTPVIAYVSKAVVEVAGDCPIYAHDALSIVDSVRKLDSLNQKELDKLTDKAYRHSSSFTWKKTAESIISIVSNSN